MNIRSKYYCVTSYDANIDETLSRLHAAGQITYYVIGKEICPTTQRRHYQIYVEFSARLRFNSAKSLLSGSCHLEKRKGSAVQASDYCKKENDWKEFGDISKSQGTRTDIESLHRSLQTDALLADVADEHFHLFLKYEKAISRYRLLRSASRNWQPEVIVFWGLTGTGKTRTVYEDNVGDRIYAHPGGPWFDGYDGQPVALFDDFGGSEFKISYLLKLLDRYPMKVPIKGSYVEWVPHRVYITSNLDPDTWYSNAHREHQAALLRRFTFVREFQ